MPGISQAPTISPVVVVDPKDTQQVIYDGTEQLWRNGPPPFTWWEGTGAGWLEGPAAANFSPATASWVLLVAGINIPNQVGLAHLHVNYEPQHGDQGDTPWNWQILGNGNLGFRPGFGQATVDTGAHIADGNPHLLIATLSSDGAHVTYHHYVDGNDLGSLVGAVAPAANGYITLGRFHAFGTTEVLQGQVSHFVVFPYTLSASAVANLSVAWSQGDFASWRRLIRTMSAQLWWELRDASIAAGHAINDSSDQGNPGQYTGSATQIATPAFGPTPGQPGVSGGMFNPMSAQDDLIAGGPSGTPTRFPKGAAGQGLILDATSGHLTWDVVRPLTTAGDLYVGGAAGAPSRLGKGGDGQVLTVDPATHLLAWSTPFTDPTTTKGDLVVHGATTTRLPVGADGMVLTADSTQADGMAWTASPSGFADPTTTKGDLIVHGATTTREPVGADGTVLTADSTQATGVGWKANPAGFADPTTTKGDLIVHGATTTREPVGADGTVLTADSTQATGVSWKAASGGTTLPRDQSQTSTTITTPNNSSEVVLHDRTVAGAAAGTYALTAIMWIAASNPGQIYFKASSAGGALAQQARRIATHSFNGQRTLIDTYVHTGGDLRVQIVIRDESAGSVTLGIGTDDRFGRQLLIS